MRVWDLPTGRCVNLVKFDRPATSLDLSPASEMMAMAYVGDLGIYLWTNKALYDRVDLQPVREEAGPPARQVGAGGGRRHGGGGGGGSTTSSQETGSKLNCIFSKRRTCGHFRYSW